MVSAIQLNQNPIVESQGQSGAAPETGEFDFMSYLLGLQASPSETDGLTLGAPTEEKSQKDAKTDTSMQALSALFPMANASQLLPDTSGEEVTGTELPKEIAPESLTYDTRTTDIATDSSQVLVNNENPGTEIGNSRNPGATAKDVALGRYAQNERADKAMYEYAAVARNPQTEVASEVNLDAMANHPDFARISDLDDVRRRENSDSPFTVISAQMNNPLNVARTEAASESITASAPQQPVAMSELFNRVETLAASGGGTMVVSLDPPDLGRVEIQVTARGKRVQVEMTSEKDMTKTLLESKFDELRSSIQSHDMTLSKLEVRTERESLHFSLNQFTQGNNDNSRNSENFGQQNRENRFSQAQVREVEMPMVGRAAGSGNSRFGSGGVDVRI